MTSEPLSAQSLPRILSLTKTFNALGTVGVCLYAYNTVPEITTSFQGIFAAAMIGAGTSLITNLYTTGTGLAGSLIGAAMAKKGERLHNGMIWGLVAGIATLPLAIPASYSYTKDVIVNGISNKAPAVSPAENARAVPPLNVPQI